MNCIKIRETKWARIAILEKILDVDNFGNTGIGRKKERNPLFISDYMDLDGLTYAIEISLFRNIIKNLESEKAIEITQLELKNVLDCVADFEGYILSRAREDVELSAEEIRGEKTLFCSFVVKDIEKIREEISHLNSLGVSLETLKNGLIKTDNGIGKDEHSAMSFDLDTGTLTVQNKPVKIRKFSKQYSFLKVIFENEEGLQKDWQFSEIAECMDSINDNEWKKLYDMASAISRSVAMETGIRDIFITTTQSIKINSKYI